MEIKRIISIVEEAVKEVVADNAKVIFHADGETANGNKTLEDFIVSTNLKYNGSNKKTLIGNYLEIRFTDITFLRIDINEFKGLSEKEIAMYVSKQLNYAKSISVNAGDIFTKIEDYVAIQNSLIIRPLHYEKAKLSEYVYIKIGDIALTLYAVVSDDAESLSTCKIPKCIFEKWGISKENVFMEAMLNTQMLSDTRIYPNILLSDLYDGEKINDITSLSDDDVPLITTKRKTNGAIAMFFPNVKERIAEMFEDSYYIVFTSIHEAVLHKKGTVSLEVIKRCLNDVNNRFSNDETLTNHIYLYDRESRKLSIVA